MAENKMTKIPEWMKTYPIADESWHGFLLKDILDKHITHLARIFRDVVYVRPISENYEIIISRPDTSITPDKDYETSIYVADNLSILLRGKQKGQMEIALETDEFPFKLTLNGRPIKID
jgi:hypothetical protein